MTSPTNSQCATTICTTIAFFQKSMLCFCLTFLVLCTLQSSDKTLQLVDNMWHVLTKEPGNQQLLQQCVDWLSQRAPIAPPPPQAAAAAASTPAAEAAAGAAVLSSRGSSSNIAAAAGEVGGESWEKVEREEAAGADA
jgi:hypothetical protein